MKQDEKVYLGDGVYVEYDGYHVMMTTENGERADNRIYLEPAVLEAFGRYLDALHEAVSARSGQRLHSNSQGERDNG